MPGRPKTRTKARLVRRLLFRGGFADRRYGTTTGSSRRSITATRLLRIFNWGTRAELLKTHRLRRSPPKSVETLWAGPERILFFGRRRNRSGGSWQPG